MDRREFSLWIRAASSRFHDVILAQMRRQAQLAIESADVIILVVDVTDGVTATDQEVAAMLQKSGKPIVVAVNKCDRVVPCGRLLRVLQLGLGRPHRRVVAARTRDGDLLDAVCDKIDFEHRDDTADAASPSRLSGGPTWASRRSSTASRERSGSSSPTSRHDARRDGHGH
jgi:GTP-binding protein